MKLSSPDGWALSRPYTCVCSLTGAKIDTKMRHGSAVILRPEIVHYLDRRTFSLQRFRGWLHGISDEQGAGVGSEVVTWPEAKLRGSVRLRRQIGYGSVGQVERHHAGLRIMVANQHICPVCHAGTLHMGRKVSPALGTPLGVQLGRQM